MCVRYGVRFGVGVRRGSSVKVGVFGRFILGGGSGVVVVRGVDSSRFVGVSVVGVLVRGERGVAVGVGF